MTAFPRILAVGLAMIATGTIGCSQKSTSAETNTNAEPIAIPVTVEPIQKKSIVRSISAVGTLYGYEEITLTPKVDGRVETIRCDVGDSILPGTVLLELEDSDFHLSIAEARQALFAELAKIGMTELPEGPVDWQQVPSVRRATVAQEDALRRLKVKKELVARNAVSKDEYDLADTDYRLAEATTVQVITEAKSILALARLRKATLDLAEQRLRDSRMMAPFPLAYEAWAATIGTAATPMRFQVSTRMVSEGEMIRAMPITNAFKLVLSFIMKLKVAVPERYSADVKVGQKVGIHVDAYPNKTFKGVIARINPTVDVLNRTFQVEIEVGNLKGDLKCGGFARAEIQIKNDDPILAIPNEALVSFAGVQKIFLQDKDRAHAVEVQVGVREKEWIEVKGNIPPDAMVITSGFSRLVEGSLIRLREKK